ncbi:formate--tetrahydrofolate ligase [Corynebacterium sp. ES2730-CONJ]|uniref:formate--tetrahydrofolate ligase n=1 Tax=Corynebacterium sp. ES2730-CONJ TaxID=2973941 RepID=UPI00216B499D|nr:formate--tetrahydrofolate ligase [Corynebacterium sp. ES2730-CONJ]MCS4530970.1 formate--tetrahydrofolate ligase [Corynebacterium sp. ES2730-CONJ]
MLSDVEIAQSHPLVNIDTIAERAGIPPAAVLPYGRNKAKIDTTIAPNRSQKGALILVTGMSPTPAGEGKSTVLIGLADAIAAQGHSTLVAIREPSLGPVFGIKGGAAGGGHSQIVPMENINLHLTGDFHAITAANNTLAAIIDNHIHQGNALGIDPRKISWQRCLDVNDRSLRHVVTGLGGPAHGVPTETGFTITAASEIMAILCLATGINDLGERLANIVVAQTFDGRPVTAADLSATGAMMALLKDALHPNLVQTLGGTPAFVHGGPFANIAHGCNSLIATQTALEHADYVLTEAGFGADLGAEKFFDIKARIGHLDIAGCVIVATIRSLKFNGGMTRQDLTHEDLSALESGIVNLEQHIENLRKFGVEPVVALNLFSTDTDSEIAWMKAWATNYNVALHAVDVWAQGGQGAAELAQYVLDNLHDTSSHPLYDPAQGLEESINRIATEIYRAKEVQWSARALKDLKYLQAHGWDTLPVCISKTQYSFSEDPNALGAAQGHVIHIRQLLPRIGAGFIVALTGDVMTMPGLPKKPAAEQITVEGDLINGLF